METASPCLQAMFVAAPFGHGRVCKFRRKTADRPWRRASLPLGPLKMHSPSDRQASLHAHARAQ
eukprot:13990936-Alexandrium_andersonii.AAC.1